MEKHTPGPWSVDRGCYTVRATNSPLRAETGLAPGAVAVAVHSVDDARLIAAAPDMLEALKKIKRHWSDQDMNHEDFRVMCFQICEEVIAKAEGR